MTSAADLCIVSLICFVLCIAVKGMFKASRFLSEKWKDVYIKQFVKHHPKEQIEDALIEIDRLNELVDQLVIECDERVEKMEEYNDRIDELEKLAGYPEDSYLEQVEYWFKVLFMLLKPAAYHIIGRKQPIKRHITQ